MASQPLLQCTEAHSELVELCIKFSVALWRRQLVLPSPTYDVQHCHDCPHLIPTYLAYLTPSAQLEDNAKRFEALKAVDIVCDMARLLETCRTAPAYFQSRPSFVSSVVLLFFL